MKNEIVRSYSKCRGVYLWQVAKKLKISEATMSRKLREELPEEEKLKFLETIDQIVKERGC